MSGSNTAEATSPWERYGLSESAWRKLSPDERRKVRYEHWYENNKKKRNARRRKKYREDDSHREKVLASCKRRRPRIREEKAQAKFEAKLEEAQEREELRKLEQSDDEGRGGGRKGYPRFVRVSGKDMWVYTSRKLANEVGRGQSTIRSWLSSDVLPGSTICIKDRYYFSRYYIAAIREACRRIYFADGNGSRELLSKFVREELMKRECSWVPVGASEDARVGPGNYPEIEEEN